VNFHMTPYLMNGTWVCPCGQQFPCEGSAVACPHPATRGKIPAMVDSEVPEWWTTHDEIILRGEVAKLAELRPAWVQTRPAWVQPRRSGLTPWTQPVAAYAPPPPRRWVREVGAWLIIAATAVGLLLLLSVGDENRSPCPAGRCVGYTTMPIQPTPRTYPGP
jgi:hypothetical protein